MAAIVIGSGAMALGYIGEIFDEKNLDRTFCFHRETEKSEILTTKMQYFHYNEDTKMEKIISFQDYIYTQISEDQNKLNDKIANPETKFIATAVREGNLEDCANSISEGLLKRMDQNYDSPLFLIPFENLSRNGDILLDSVCSTMKTKDKTTLKEKLSNSNIYFLNAIVDRICNTPKVISEKGEIHVSAEDYSELIIDTESVPQKHLKSLSEYLPEKIILESNPLRFEAYEERKLWLINGVHLAISAIAYKNHIPEIHEALIRPEIYTLIREVQSELLNAFRIKHSNVSDKMPFNETSLLAFNNEFLYRCNVNKKDTPQRVLKDLLSFDSIGEYKIEDFVKLINLCDSNKKKKIDDEKCKETLLLFSNEVSTFSDELIRKIYSESSLFSKIDVRILDPIIRLEIVNAKKLCLVLIILLNTLNDIMYTMKQKLRAELEKTTPNQKDK